MEHHWPLDSSDLRMDCRVFEVHEDRRRHPVTDAARPFYRLHCADWVNVIPLTDDGRVVLVRQFRAGVRQETLEIPGGIVDPGESPATAALRELREETGWTGELTEPLSAVQPNPALFDNLCHTFVAPSVELVGEPTPDDGELTTVELAPLTEIPGLIEAGRIQHALVIAAFYRLFARDGFPGR